MHNPNENIRFARSISEFRATIKSNDPSGSAMRRIQRSRVSSSDERHLTYIEYNKLNIDYLPAGNIHSTNNGNTLFNLILSAVINGRFFKCSYFAYLQNNI